MAKPFPDESFPIEIQQNDLPSGMFLYEQQIFPFHPLVLKEKQKMEKQFLQTYKALQLGGDETNESKIIKENLCGFPLHHSKFGHVFSRKDTFLAN